MVRTAASISAAVRSGHFCVATSSNCARLTLPTLLVLGFGEPFLILATFISNTDAGGVFLINLNERSAYTVMITGIGKPSSMPCVSALNCLQNSMILTPC